MQELPCTSCSEQMCALVITESRGAHPPTPQPAGTPVSQGNAMEMGGRVPGGAQLSHARVVKQSLPVPARGEPCACCRPRLKLRLPRESLRSQG